MFRKWFLTMTTIAGLFAAGEAAAMPITFSDATPNNIGSNGSTSVTFSLNAATQNIGSTQISFAVGEVDEGFGVTINGTQIFDVAAFDLNDPGHPVGVSPGLNAPWSSSGGNARILVDISATAVTLSGLINAGDGTYTALTLASAAVLPTFVDGLNTFNITNNNEFGPGGIRNMAISGTVAVPEPATLGMFGLGLAGLGFAARRRKTA